MCGAQIGIDGLSQWLFAWMGDRTSPVEIELLKRIMDGQATCLVYPLLAAGIIFVGKFIQARAEAVAKHEGWIVLDWKEPIDGGAVASYKIKRRLRPAGDWALISVALESEATLNNQERNKDWEYRIIAVNKAGEGAPSNTAAAVV